LEGEGGRKKMQKHKNLDGGSWMKLGGRRREEEDAET
jgi:hypothetical protein